MGQRLKQSPTLIEVKQHFEDWRKTRKKIGPIPDQLWRESISLLSEYTISRVAKTLQLSPADLKKRRSKLGSVEGPDLPFVKVEGSVITQALKPALAATVLDFQRPDGFRLRIEPANQAETVVLLDHFMEGGSCCN